MANATTGPVLIVAAHPDDEVLGCGGLARRLADAGQDVYITILGEGVTSRYADRTAADTVAVASLHEKSHEVGRLLGARQVFLHGLPDNRFDTVPLLEVVKILEGHVNDLQPEVVYTHHGGDLNIDHLVTYRATLTATRPMQGTPVKAVYAYEVASSTEWAFQRLGQPFHPTLFVDISTSLERKIAAMQHYESEARPFPHPRSPESLRAIATRWGSAVGLGAAEVFEVIREIR